MPVKQKKPTEAEVIEKRNQQIFLEEVSAYVDVIGANYKTELRAVYDGNSCEKAMIHLENNRGSFPLEHYSLLEKLLDKHGKECLNKVVIARNEVCNALSELTKTVNQEENKLFNERAASENMSIGKMVEEADKLGHDLQIKVSRKNHK